MVWTGAYDCFICCLDPRNNFRHVLVPLDFRRRHKVHGWNSRFSVEQWKSISCCCCCIFWNSRPHRESYIFCRFVRSLSAICSKLIPMGDRRCIRSPTYCSLSSSSIQPRYHRRPTSRLLIFRQLLHNVVVCCCADAHPDNSNVVQA